MEKTTKAIENGRMQGEWKISRKKNEGRAWQKDITRQDKAWHGMVWRMAYGVWHCMVRQWHTKTKQNDKVQQ